MDDKYALYPTLGMLHQIYNGIRVKPEKAIRIVHFEKSKTWSPTRTEAQKTLYPNFGNVTSDF